MICYLKEMKKILLLNKACNKPESSSFFLNKLIKNIG